MTRRFVSGLLLAAGLSSRFGRVKQLAELEGMSMVERAAQMLIESDVDEVVVVVGHAADDVRKRLDEGSVKVVLNAKYKSGLSSSLRLGVASLDARSEAVVVCLADQPFVTSELVNKIVALFRKTRADAIAASSGDLVSPPVLLGWNLYGRVGRLRGDKGAKAIVLEQPKFERVEVDPEVLLDIDTEDELSRASRLSRPTSRKGRAPAAGGPSRGRPSSGP
ncbi:MAG: nucleotidyltransferase family protein [Thaumarchaeota archaeon]|nr:nucleotidyltransferase family protein [Nitrososphaerota archaeon]